MSPPLLNYLNCLNYPFPNVIHQLYTSESKTELSELFTSHNISQIYDQDQLSNVFTPGLSKLPELFKLSELFELSQLSELSELPELQYGPMMYKISKFPTPLEI